MPLSVSTESKPAPGYMLFHRHAVSREDELRLQKADLPSRRLYKKSPEAGPKRSGLFQTYIKRNDKFCVHVTAHRNKFICNKTN